MRAVMQIIGIILLINGIGGLWNDGFGLLDRFASGTALTALQVGVIAVGAALIGWSLLGRKRATSSRRKTGQSYD